MNSIKSNETIATVAMNNNDNHVAHTKDNDLTK